MSIDFGGTKFVKIKKRVLSSLINIDDIFYMSDCWYDNKCGPTEGYYRNTIFFNTKEYELYYIIDNRIFSGFVDSERIVAINKKTNERKIYKLEQQNEYKDDSFNEMINNSYELDSNDYEFIKEEDFDAYFDEEYGCNKKHCPLIHLISNEEDYIVVEALINEVEYLIIFKFDHGKLINVMHYNNETSDMNVMVIKEPSEKEYIDAAMKANSVLSDSNNNCYSFEKNIDIKNDEIFIKSNDNEISDQYDKVEKQCINAMRPDIPKLNIAQYDGKTLTMPTGCDYLSKYLVKFILHSLNITSDDDLNNYYYYDDGLEELELDLVIPGSVKVIGNGAFINKPFKTITFNEGVEVIGSYSFYRCDAEEIKLASTIVSINQKAFSGNKIKEIYLSNKLNYISGDVFFRCEELSKINIDENNDYYKTNDSKNVLIDKKDEKVIFALDEQ